MSCAQHTLYEELRAEFVLHDAIAHVGVRHTHTVSHASSCSHPIVALAKPRETYATVGVRRWASTSRESKAFVIAVARDSLDAGHLEDFDVFDLEHAEQRRLDRFRGRWQLRACCLARLRRGGVYVRDVVDSCDVEHVVVGEQLDVAVICDAIASRESDPLHTQS
eukprot:2800617-Prymnesium_polylepis.1